MKQTDSHDDSPDHIRSDAPARPPINRKMLEALVCPVTQGRLNYDAIAQELISPTARLAFPIRNGIPIMLASEARELE